MKCPVCGSEMESGMLEGQRYLLWSKKKHRITYRPREGELLLGEKTVGGVQVAAQLCRQCRKIVLDCDTAQKN